MSVKGEVIAKEILQEGDVTELTPSSREELALRSTP